VGGREDITPLALRVTMTFRPEDGTWKVVHHHADPITTAQPAESVIQKLAHPIANFLEPRTGEVPRTLLPPKGMKALPLATHQALHVQPGQGSGATGSSRLQGFEFVQSLVEPSGEMGLVSGPPSQGASRPAGGAPLLIEVAPGRTRQYTVLARKSVWVEA
jgi:hypothetical protein